MDRTAEAQKIFSADRFATNAADIRILKAEDNYALCSMPLSENHFNANGFVMGGAIFTLADFAFAVATNTDPDTMTVSLTSQITYLRPACGRELTAETAVLHMGHRSCVLEITICNEEGALVAKASITGMRTAKPKL